MRIQAIASAITLVLVSSAWSTVAAQQHQRRHQGGAHEMMQGRGMMGGMAALHVHTPATLLERKADLALTEEQVSALSELRDEAAATRDQAQAAHDSHRDRLMEALATKDPDPKMVRGYFDGAHAAMGSAHWADIDAALKAMRILTDEQRAKVMDWVKEMQM